MEMKKKNILLSLLLIIILGACKIESQNPGEVKLIKEDFDLDIMDKYDGGNIVDFGTGVYSIKDGKDSRLSLKLTSFNKGEEEKIFEIGLPDLEEGEKLGFELSSNQVNVYEISDKKISQVTKFDYENKFLKIRKQRSGNGQKAVFLRKMSFSQYLQPYLQIQMNLHL